MANEIVASPETIAAEVEEQRRNRQIEAAAHDMLAALKRAVKRADDNLAGYYGRSVECSEDYEACVRAIAKAEGK